MYPPREFRCLENSSMMSPFGVSTTRNVLEYFQGTPEIVTKVNDSSENFLIFLRVFFVPSSLFTDFVCGQWRLEKCSAYWVKAY